MSNDIDPRQMYEALRAFHTMEQQQSQAANVVMAEMMNWLSKRIEANSEFLSMFGHIAPQPLSSPGPAPARHEPPPVPRAEPAPGSVEWVDEQGFEARLAEMRAKYPINTG